MKWLLVIKMKQTPCKQCQTHTTHTQWYQPCCFWINDKLEKLERSNENPMWSRHIVMRAQLFFFKYIFDVLSFLSWKSNGLHNQFIIISCIEMCAMRKCNSLYWNCKIDFNAYTWAHRQRCIFKRVSILFLAPDLLLWSAPIYRSN